MAEEQEKKAAGTELEEGFSSANQPIVLEEDGTKAADDSAALAVEPAPEELIPEPDTPAQLSSTANQAAETTNLIEALEASEEILLEPDTLLVERLEETDSKTLYKSILLVLHKASDLGIDAVAKGYVAEALGGDKLPQLVCRDLVSRKVINKIQLARAVARAQHRMEIMSFLDLPPDAIKQRKELPKPVVNLLRDRRIIPLKVEEDEDGNKYLHLAHEASAKDLVLESGLTELLPSYKFIWHFCMRDVAGAYWLSGESTDVDTGMEAEALLDRIIGNAIDARSSDIHIDPSIRGEPRAIVKYRIDGSVMPKEVITAEQLDRLRVRIENIARMPKVNHTHPNKGSFTRAGFDWRVQIQPHSSPHGSIPRIVLRQLKPDVIPMETLGYPKYFIDQIKAAAQAPNGVIFWTGPTGSGKTESIHSAIVSVNPMAKGLSVHTIEDPPEKRVPGYALQMEAVEEDAPRSSLNLLKSSLRADPDIIVIGEVRDKEMAKLVFEAANTGHLVFSTLHTNTALDAIIRLDELQVSGFLLSYIRGIAAQKLVRRLCVHCREEIKEPNDYTKYVFDRYGVDMEGASLYKASQEGCPSCNFMGYYGRIAVAEWLVPSKELVESAARGEFENLEDIARRAGWQPMGYMGVLHIKSGITDAEELSRKIMELSGDLL